MIRTKIWYFALFLLLGAQGIAQTKSALFIGNSYTYYNNLPQLVSDIASSNGDSLIFDSNTPGGSSFQGHSADPVTIKKIQSQNWDFVILQEQSQRPAFPPSQVQSDVYPYASALDQLIQQNDSCTKTLFYMTWGRKHGDAQNCQFYQPLCTYQGMQQRLRESYVEMANLNNASVAPVGMAWKYSIANDSNLNLYNSDNSHPNVFGSYLAACVFYSSMYYKSSVGLFHPSSIPSGTAYVLQNIADLTVFDSLSVWSIDTLTSIQPMFAYSQNGSKFDFTDQTGAVGANYLWDFGDGSTSQLQNPSHTYSQNGSHRVRLMVDLNCDFGWVDDTVEVIYAKVQERSEGEVMCYPNPVKDKLTILLKDESQSVLVSQMNVSGQVVQSKQYEKTSNIELDILGPKGIYFLLITTEKSQTRFKILKE